MSRWSAIRWAWWCRAHRSTLPVTLDHMVYHTAAVARGLSATLLVADLPFMSDRDVAHALEAGARLVGRGRCGDGQDRRRRAARPGGHRGAGRARHSGLRAPGPDPAVGAQVRRLPHPGARAGCGRPRAGRGPGGAGRRRRPAGAGGRAGGAGPAHHRSGDDSDHRHRRRSALRRPGAGAARLARHHAGQATEVQQGFPRRARFGGGRDRAPSPRTCAAARFPAPEHCFN